MNGDRISFSWLRDEWFREMNMIEPNFLSPRVAMAVSSPMKTIFKDGFAIGAL